MDAPKLPESKPTLSIERAEFEIVLADEVGGVLSLVSPPLSDISEMADLNQAAFSLKDHHASAWRDSAGLSARLVRLESKKTRFAQSAKFFTRLSNLQAAVGDFGDEAESRERAAALSDEPFFERRAAEAASRQGLRSNALERFKGLAAVDSQSGLRLAAHCIASRDLESARDWVEGAVALNPAGYAERLFQGAIRLVTGEYSQAIAFLRIAIDDRPQSSVAHYNLGLAYLGLERPDRAFEALKRSVGFDPFNRSALVALADVATNLNLDVEVLTSLRYFVEFEQQDSAVWERLARSLLQVGLVGDCIAALKRQGATQNSLSVWNNLGVAYAVSGQVNASLQAFKHSLSFIEDEKARDAILVSRNIAQLMTQRGEFSSAHSITSAIIESDRERGVAGDARLWDVYAMHVSSLFHLERKGEAVELMSELLVGAEMSSDLTRWVVSTLVSFHGLERSDDDALLSLLEMFRPVASSGKKDLKVLNNFAFAYAEIGRVQEALACVSQVSSWVHRDPYLTATLGLISFRKGNVERGESLYREAIALAKSHHDKARIRQKLNLELGKSLLETDERKSGRLLERAAVEKDGEKALGLQARKLIKTLSQRRGGRS